jgi:hypothetical protein
MATSSYIQGRKKWERPQALIWSENSGLLDPDTGVLTIDGEEGNNFIILSDHNRSPISFDKNRIENRQRLINGHMRSYHIADKLTISWDWEELPSRSFSSSPNFNIEDGKPVNLDATQYVVDGGAGGVDIVNWYENHPGSFYMFASYDRFDKFNTDKYLHLNQYSEIYEVYFASFEYSVNKRGFTNHDLWTINIALEEV